MDLFFWGVPVRNLYTVSSDINICFHFCSVADPDPGPEKIRYGSGSRPNFNTDPDPGKNDTGTNQDPSKRGFSTGTRKIVKI